MPPFKTLLYKIKKIKIKIKNKNKKKIYYKKEVIWGAIFNFSNPL